MVNRLDSLDRVFRALADPTRRAMLTRLAKGQASIGTLGDPFAMTKAAVTKHVKVLERAGLLVRAVEGRVHTCRIDPAPLTKAEQWVEQVRSYWEGRLDELSGYLANPESRRAP